MHIVHLMANNSSVPYFNWFAEEIKKYPSYKFSFVAMHSSSPKMLIDMAERGCDCYWIPFDCNKRKRSIIIAIPKLARLFNKIKPDVINTHLFDDSFPALIAAKLVGIKKRVITKNDTTFHWNYAKKWVWADKLNNLLATNIVAVSNESMNFILNKEKAPNSKVTMIHHGIAFNYLCNQNDSFKKEIKDKYNLHNCLVIGTVARYIDWKGYKYIIQAASEVVKNYPNAKFLFIGEGPQRKELENLLEETNLKENIILTGWVDKDYIPSFYGIMDLYLHAAIKEPFGFVIAEAMANGVPIISTKTGAAADALIHQKDSFLIKEKDPNEIVNGISWMIENEEKWHQMRPLLKKKSDEMYSTKLMTKKYLDLYDK